MPDTRKFRAIRGVRDILPPDTALWNRVEAAAREVFESYNFREIRLPIFEQTELFARSVGADTDIVAKEMYTFPDHAHRGVAGLQYSLSGVRPKFDQAHLCELYLARLGEFLAGASELFAAGEIPRTPDNARALRDLGSLLGRLKQIRTARESYAQQSGGAAGKWDLTVTTVGATVDALVLGEDVTLRPEATASVVRAFIEHGMHTWPQPVKLYYLGPMFRRERPQKGRYRQFYQIGAEVLGPSDAPAIDAEVIEMLLVFFARVGLAQTTLYINSIGCRNCRPNYVELLRAKLEKVGDRLGPDSRRRIATNPLRVLDSKLDEEQAVIEKLPRISDHLCAECREHFAKLKEELKLRRIEYTENWRLVRGLDYYMRTTFEVTAAGLGAQNAICGGGRYDGLVELLGGPAGIKGIGFAIGSDRAILSIQQTGNAPAPRGLDVFLAWMGEGAYAAAVALAARLRRAGFSVELPPEEMKLKRALSLADKLGARYAVIIGEDELKSRTLTVKRLADSTQQKLTEAELESLLRPAYRPGRQG